MASLAEKLAQEGATVVVDYSHSADKAQEVVSAITAQHVALVLL